MYPSSCNGSQKPTIIILADAVIEPDAMMIKIFNTSITFLTVFCFYGAISITVFAVKYFIHGSGEWFTYIDN